MANLPKSIFSVQMVFLMQTIGCFGDFPDDPEPWAPNAGDPASIPFLGTRYLMLN